MAFTGQVFQYSRGTSYAPGTLIDAYLTETDNARLYERWDKSWPEPLGFRGGEKGITCEMVLGIPEKEFIKIIGKAPALRILEIAKQNAGR